MRIVTWNCGMALARKAPSLLALNPDIAVVQECSKKSVDDLHFRGFSGLWYGANSNKGLAVFCSKGLMLQAAGEPFGKWVVPVRVQGAVDFNLLAIWGQGITDVLHDGTDALAMLAAKDGLTRVGAGQFAAVIDILKDVEENAKKAQEASEFKSTVQEQIRKVDSLINENTNNAAAQREKLEAVEAIKDAVVAACNSGQTTQASPEFTSSADTPQPVPNFPSRSYRPILRGGQRCRQFVFQYEPRQHRL